MLRWFTLLALLTFSQVYLSTASAQPDTNRPGLDTAFHPTPNPSLHVGRRVGDINIDGDLNDEGWKHAAHVDQFSCSLPIPGTCPKVRTEAFICYDERYLYIAMIAHDDHPEAIRSSKVGRDKMFDDDFMGIILDTYGDATRAFEIYANPKGIQGDLFWTATNEDESYDMVFDAESKITATGWQTEFRIPFHSLRFPEKDVQNFHATFWRNWPRESDYKMSWAPINFGNPCAFCQLGSFTGIEKIKPAGKLDLLPALVASQDATTPTTSDPNAKLQNGPLKLKPSLGIGFALGPATDLEAAIKPDFSQVEADQAQVSANTTFALFYPEHRPFFQDGSDLLNTTINAVYTRSINNPFVTAKAIHRDATTSIAYVGGYDENSPMILPLEERSVILPDVGKSLSNILRATRTLADDTYVGLIATDRRYQAGGSNSVGGFDTRIAIYENIEFIGQSLWSYTNEGTAPLVGTSTLFDQGRHTLELDGEKFWGAANYFGVQRFTPGLDLQFDYYDHTPGFRAGNGFITSNDVEHLGSFIGYKFPQADPPNWLKWLVEVDGSLTTGYQWNFEGITKGLSFKPELDLGLTSQTNLHLFYRKNFERFHDIDFRDLYQWDVNGSMKIGKFVSVSGELTLGRGIARTVAIPTSGKSLDAMLSLRFKPFEGLLIEPTFLFSQLKSDSGINFYSGAIYFARVSYQFTRELNLRTIVQYDDFAKNFEVDPLLTYKVNPFTSFFIGSTHNFASPDGIAPIVPSDRQFFAKVQYLIQT